MTDPAVEKLKRDKHALAEHLGDFITAHGAEEAGKLVSRFLLGLGCLSGGQRYEFTDDVGRVIIEPATIKDRQKH